MRFILVSYLLSFSGSRCICYDPAMYTPKIDTNLTRLVVAQDMRLRIHAKFLDEVWTEGERMGRFLKRKNVPRVYGIPGRCRKF